jgi:hypothetical protein
MEPFPTLRLRRTSAHAVATGQFAIHLSARGFRGQWIDARIGPSRQARQRVEPMARGSSGPLPSGIQRMLPQSARNLVASHGRLLDLIEPDPYLQTATTLIRQ